MVTGRGSGRGTAERKGDVRNCFLLFLCTVSLTVVGTCYHLIFNKILIKWDGGKREIQETEGERERKAEGRREAGRGGGRQGKIEKQRERETKTERELTKQKLPAGQRRFTVRSLSTLPECQDWRVLFFFPLFFPKVNVLIYLEEELCALWKATFTEGTVAEALSRQAGCSVSPAGVQAGAEGSCAGEMGRDQDARS